MEQAAGVGQIEQRERAGRFMAALYSHFMTERPSSRCLRGYRQRQSCGLLGYHKPLTVEEEEHRALRLEPAAPRSRGQAARRRLGSGAATHLCLSCDAEWLP